MKKKKKEKPPFKVYVTPKWIRFNFNGEFWRVCTHQNKLMVEHCCSVFVFYGSKIKEQIREAIYENKLPVGGFDYFGYLHEVRWLAVKKESGVSSVDICPGCDRTVPKELIQYYNLVFK